MSFMKDFDHLKVQMKDIVSATNNFDRANVIGRGGFGKVYKGQLSLPEGQITVAFKKLDRRLGQGNIEFWKEIIMLSKYKHENLISLMHFCIEGDEMILVYEYASRGSLDRYLSDASTLTWIQRLRISVGAARGLHYLHDPMETQQRVLHRDIKSANILLDENWTAKVSDFGLSKIGPANQPHSYLVSNVVGTPGYCDPLYWELGFLSKESDVYSFGVVLFEVLCGRFCFEYNKGKLSNILVPKWKRCYEEKRLDEIILVGLKEQMDPGSLSSFSAIAYRCVKRAREDRPTMAEVVKDLEFSLEQQDILENLGKKVDFAELVSIANFAVRPLSYGPRSQLLRIFLKGFLIDGGETWISLNMNGEFTKVVSANKCFFGKYLVNRLTDPFLEAMRVQNIKCRFPYYSWEVYSHPFRVEVDTQFLSPHVTYIIYILFKYGGTQHAPSYMPFQYKLKEETDYSTSCIPYISESDGWAATKLYQFTNIEAQHKFCIEFLPRDRIPFRDEFAFEGVEFRPLESETCEKQGEEQIKVNKDFLPSDFTDIITLSKEVIQWSTNNELFVLLRKGFLTIEGEKWFSISKNLKKLVMIPASTFLDEEEWTYNSIPEPESRFKVATKSLISHQFSVHLTVDLQIMSPQTKHSCHLIYKLANTNYSSFNGPMIIGVTNLSNDHMFPLSICLNPHCHPPVIGACSDDKRRSINMKDHSKPRKDGWMEVQISEVSISDTGTIKESYKFFVEEDQYKNNNFLGSIVIEGIEFRPLRID